MNNDSLVPLGRPVVGITLGDQSGVGPEIVEASLACGRLSSQVEWRVLGQRRDFPLGKANLESAQAAWADLELAAEGLKTGALSAVVTAPVCKESLQEVGFSWPGQTEFFAQRLGVKNYAMCLSGEHLTVGLVTIHVPLASVSGLLRQEDIVRVGLLLADFCQKKGILCPRIALAGLNPHAGEGGLFGSEEERLLVPALEELQKKGLSAQFSGPHVPDALFREAYLGAYDAVLCLYHDQGLIPLKMVDFDTAVNITLGLPRPRFSPDHGTAFSLAGKGVASPESFLCACRLASQWVLNDKSASL